MKEKLIAKLLQIILDMRESAANITVDLNENPKEDYISNLLIPFMQITDSENVMDLHQKLLTFTAADFESDAHKDLVNKIVDVLIEGMDNSVDIENFTEKLDSIVTNAYALVNDFNKLKEDTTKDESGLDKLNADIINYISSTGADDNTLPGDKTENEKLEAGSDTGSAEQEDGAEDDVKGGIEIISASDQVDETPWADVNQVEQKNLLMDAIQNELPGAKEAVDEMYGLVVSYDKAGDWKWPHHVIQTGEVDEKTLVLNVNGLKTAALFLLKPNTSKNLSSEQKTSIAAHLLRHYNEIKTDAPVKLANLADSKESCVVINVKDDEMKEFGEMFGVGEEDVATYIGLMESFLTDLLGAGLIDIESESKLDESMVALKLDKAQAEEMIKWFDVMTDDITKILNSDFSALSYKISNSDLESRVQESEQNAVKLESAIKSLNESVKTKEAKIKELDKIAKEVGLNRAKFEAIINFVKSIDGIEDSLVQFISNVIEAEEVKQIEYLLKLSGSFMRSNQKHTFKKISLINNITTKDVNTLDELLSDEDRDSNKIDHLAKNVQQTVNLVSELF